jgi:hypothetical protein
VHTLLYFFSFLLPFSLRFRPLISPHLSVCTFFFCF